VPVAPSRAVADLARSPRRLDGKKPEAASAESCDVEKLLDRLRTEQERRWRRRDRVPVEWFLEKHPELRDDVRTFALVYGEYLLRERHGERVSLREFQQRFPHFARELKLQVEAHRIFASLDPARKLATGKVRFRSPLESVFPEVPGYQIQCELGRSKTGVVYLARQHVGKRLVALKMLQRDDGDNGLSSGGAPQREAVERLRHPNLAQIHAMGTHEGRLFVAHEYMDGGSLCQKWHGPQHPQAVAALVEIVARAIHHAHQAGVVHGNLKPANVLLCAADEQGSSNGKQATGITPWGSPKVSDFGVAGGKTRAPEYAAPEVAAGDAELTPSVDIYAIGAILYEGLTGRPPFSAWEPQETVRQTLEDEPVPPCRLQPIVPRDLETICRKCLAKKPLHRYASAAALANDLRRFLDGEAIEAHAETPMTMRWKWYRRSALAAGLLAGVGFLALLGVALIWWN